MLRHPLVLGVSTEIESTDDDGYIALLRDDAEVDDVVLRLLADVLDDAAVVLDVGANIGVHAIAAARIASRGRVTAFEPSPSTADFLVRNLARNQVTAVDVRRVALGSKSGELTFFHNTEYAAGSTVIENSAHLLRDNLGSGEVITVSVTTLMMWQPSSTGSTSSRSTPRAMTPRCCAAGLRRSPGYGPWCSSNSPATP